MLQNLYSLLKNAYFLQVKELIANDNLEMEEDNPMTFQEEDTSEENYDIDEEMLRNEERRLQLASLEWEFRESQKHVIQSCVNFHDMACDMYNSDLNGSNKSLYARKWRNLLNEIVDIQRGALIKANEFCNALDN